MIKWEYCVIRLGLGDLKKKFDEYGEDGWELVSVDGNYAYFKRPKK